MGAAAPRSRRSLEVCSGCCWCDGDVEAHGFELGDEFALTRRVVAALVEVVGAEVAVDLAGGQQVPADHQDRVADCDGGFAWPGVGRGCGGSGRRGRCSSSVRRLGRLRRARCVTILIRVGCGRCGVCLRTRCCRGTCLPTTRDALRLGSGTCRCRSQRGSPARSERTRRGSHTAGAPPLDEGPTTLRPVR